MNICLKPIGEDNFLDAFNLKREKDRIFMFLILFAALHRHTCTVRSVSRSEYMPMRRL